LVLAVIINLFFSSPFGQVYYWAINLLLILGKTGLYLLGYRRRIVQSRQGCSPTRAVRTVFYRPPTNTAEENGTDTKAKTPIVFCHGLGVGYVHYLWTLWALPATSPVYLLDFPNITMTLGAETQPSVVDTTLLVKDMLQIDGHRSACFVAHSFGSICVSWLLNSRDAAIRSLVKSAVLIDPISLMLFDPAVAFNFVHRRPSNSVQIMMSYFVSQELYISHTLARMFSWSHAALFLDDVPEHVRVEVMLSGDDAIVPAKLVRAYVDRHQLQRTLRRNGVKGKQGVSEATTGRCVWFDKVHHGQLMLHRRYVMAISKSIRACM
jgi:pimeloyl-ACP methyl ester carboxylesterase